MTEPRQIEVARSLIGTHEGDNPVITEFARKIGELYPEMKSYAANYTNDGIAWCGVFVAYCLAMSGVRPVFGPADTDKWMWAQAWKQFGTSVTVPQIGDVLVLARHVTMYAGQRDNQYIGLGGNQSDSVKESLYPRSSVEAIRRPPQAAKISTEPDKPATPFVPLDQRTIDAITTAAASSELVRYSWNDRGRGPIGYIKGMAVTYGMELRKLAARDSAALAMVRVVEGDGDVFDHMEQQFRSAGIVTLGAPEVDRLRALWTVLTGLGMRESSGLYSEGRDMSASNTSADTAEAGLFQMSWNANTTSPEIRKLFDAYSKGGDGFFEIFREGVRVKNSEPVGEGNGEIFQFLTKTKPAFAVEAAAIGLRTLYTHWGPIIRREAEIVPAADALFRQVQEIVGAVPATQRPVPMPATPDPVVVDPPKPAPVPQPGTNVPVPVPHLDENSIYQFISQFASRAKRALITGVTFYNALNRNDPIVPADLFGANGQAPQAPATTSPIGSEHIGVGGLLTTLLLQAGDLVGHAIGPNATTTGSLLTAIFGGLAGAGTLGKIGPALKIGFGVLSRLSGNKQ